MDDKLIDKIAITFEVVNGSPMSVGAKLLVCNDLEGYHPDAVSDALDSCRKKCKGRLSLADIVGQIDDGRPGANEAWGLIPTEADRTVVWTVEMCEAMECAWPLMHDKVAARMAFLESYRKLVDKSRDNGIPVKWSVSLGENTQGRLPILNRAILEGKITEQDAMLALPSAACPVTGVKQLAGGPESQKRNIPNDVKQAIEESKIRLAELAATPNKWSVR